MIKINNTSLKLYCMNEQQKRTNLIMFKIFHLQEITLDVFLQLSWRESRLHIPPGKTFIDLPWEFRQLIWMPDLFIWQLQTMRIHSVLQEIAELRLYSNGTVSLVIGLVFYIYIKHSFYFILYLHKHSPSFIGSVGIG